MLQDASMPPEWLVRLAANYIPNFEDAWDRRWVRLFEPPPEPSKRAGVDVKTTCCLRSLRGVRGNFLWLQAPHGAIHGGEIVLALQDREIKVWLGRCRYCASIYWYTDASEAEINTAALSI